MPQTFLITLVVGVVVAILTALFTHFIQNKGISDKMFKVAETVTERHSKQMHQLDINKFVEDEIDEHEEKCGKNITSMFNDLKKDVKSLETKMQHMELKQVKSNLKMNLVTNMLGEIAKKMEIKIDPTKIANGDDDE
jgi:hypothetical protein